MRRPSTHQDNATCLGCSYALRELTTNTCPECGRGFDPGDPATFKWRRGPDFTRLRITPMGWPMAIATALPAGLVLVDLSAPHLNGWVCLGLVLFPLMLFAWLLRVALQAIDGPRLWRSWLVFPAICGLTVLLIWMDAPLRARFAMSQSAFERALSQPVSGRRGIGLFVIQRVSHRGPVTLFETGRDFEASGLGFAHFPPGARELGGIVLYQSLGGGWYVYREPT